MLVRGGGSDFIGGAAGQKQSPRKKKKKRKERDKSERNGADRLHAQRVDSAALPNSKKLKVSISLKHTS